MGFYALLVACAAVVLFGYRRYCRDAASFDAMTPEEQDDHASRYAW